MKYWPFFFIALLTQFAQAADVRISDLPLGFTPGSNFNNSIPYVDLTDNTTKRFTFGDIVNIPSLVAKYAPINAPTFTGTVTGSTFSGILSGSANLPTGSLGTASAYFNSLTSSGFWSSASNVLDFQISGVNKFSLSSSGLSLLGPVNFNFNQSQNMRLENWSTDPSPGTPGRIGFNSSTLQIKLDTGSAMVPVGGSRVVLGTYAAPTTLSTTGIQAVNARWQLQYIVGAGGAIDMSAVNPQISAGFSDGDELVIMSTSSINTVKFSDGNGLSMNSDAVMGLNTIQQFIWSQGAGLWVEGYRNDRR